MSAALRAWGTPPRGCCARHLVEAAQSRGDLGSRVRLARQVLGGRQCVLDQRVLLDDRPHQCRRPLSIGAMNSGGRVSTSSGGSPASSRSRLRPRAPEARASPPTTSDGVALGRCDRGQRVVDDLLLRDADFGQRRCGRRRHRCDAPRCGPGSVSVQRSLGDDDAVDRSAGASARRRRCRRPAHRLRS